MLELILFLCSSIICKPLPQSNNITDDIEDEDIDDASNDNDENEFIPQQRVMQNSRIRNGIAPAGLDPASIISSSVASGLDSVARMAEAGTNLAATINTNKSLVEMNTKKYDSKVEMNTKDNERKMKISEYKLEGQKHTNDSHLAQTKWNVAGNVSTALINAFSSGYTSYKDAQVKMHDSDNYVKRVAIQSSAR